MKRLSLVIYSDLVIINSFGNQAQKALDLDGGSGHSNFPNWLNVLVVIFVGQIGSRLQIVQAFVHTFTQLQWIELALKTFVQIFYFWKHMVDDVSLSKESLVGDCCKLRSELRRFNFSRVTSSWSRHSSMMDLLGGIGMARVASKSLELILVSSS
ncbi:hypothetical protein BpHYR1_031111 [Brachionus plicatilis]|uniref:Uncharacterized protein n=1 Tax=Brachionus plicatilis TaxID=10195 RepID=A0A3M7RRY3_BRAPC|nr:hypothetical protein BpHYR1_031111 [Brachionus plicatilis]